MEQEIHIPAATWTDLYALASFGTGVPFSIYNDSKQVVRISTNTTQPTDKYAGIPTYVKQLTPIPVNVSAWAYSREATTLILTWAADHVSPVEIKYAPAQLDAFSRLRVSNPTTLFDSQSQYDDGTTDKFFHKVTTGGSTLHLPDQSSVRMITDATAGASVVRQSQRYIRYQPGKSQLIFATFDFGEVDSATKKVGYFDGENGVFFEVDAAGDPYIVLRSKSSGIVVDTRKSSADWNIDTFDSTGISGITLDAALAQLLVIDLQWLSTGRVRVGFDINGVICYAHEFFWANLDSGVYMTTANLPVRYELIGNGNVSQMQAICCSVSSEGGFVADLGHEHVTPNGTTSITANDGVDTHIISIRPKLLINSIPNRAEYRVDRVSFYIDTKPAIMKMVHGATVTGGSWVSAGNGTGVEYNIGGVVSGGHITDSEFGAATKNGITGGTSTRNQLFLVLDIDAAHTDEGTFSVIAAGVGGNALIYANIHWTEVK